MCLFFSIRAYVLLNIQEDCQVAAAHQTAEKTLDFKQAIILTFSDSREDAIKRPSTPEWGRKEEK